MNFPFKNRKADLAAFLSLFFLSVLLIFMSEEAKVRVARATVRASLSPLQKALSWVSRPFRVYSQSGLLRRELTELSLENQVLRECGEENKRLRTLLEFKEKTSYEIEPVEVIGKDPGRLPATILVGRGAREGIKPNLPCITHQGLVGKTVEVSQETALIQTIFDPDSRVSCLLQRSRVLGILRYRRGGCVLENVLLHSDVEVGDEVVSSGMGGVFPKGLRVGTVVDVASEGKGLFRKVTVKPAIDLSRVEEVFVILREEERPLLPEELLPLSETSVRELAERLPLPSESLRQLSVLDLHVNAETGGVSPPELITPGE